jgi:protein O-mannosyl-transferase
MRTKTSILLLIFIGLLLYLNSLFNSFLGDDFLQIVDNSQVHSFRNIFHFFAGSTYESGGSDKLSGLFYRPVMLTFFSLIYSIFGLNPSFFHLIQILFHITNSVLLFLFYRSFFKNTASFFISAIFLVHPVNNEAVVYIANLQETLFFFFGMIGLLMIQKSTNNVKNHLLTAFMFLLSLLSKETGMLFLIVSLIFCKFYIPKKLKSIFLITIIVTSMYLILRYPVAHMHLAQGSVTPLYNASLSIKVLNMPAIFVYYLKTFFYPLQMGSHHFWMIRGMNYSQYFIPLVISFLFLSGLVISGVILYKKKSKIFIHYLFFSFWFILGMLLHIQIIPLDVTVADRWFYFPIVGLLGVITILLMQLKFRGLFLRKVSIAGLVFLLLLLSLRTFERNFDWKDELTLFGHDIKTTQQNFFLNNSYATALISDEQFEKAKPYVIASLYEFPYYANLNNMAIILVSEKNFKEAKIYLSKAAQGSRNYVVYENYANFLLAYDNLNEASVFTKKSLQVFPSDAKLHLILSKIYYVQRNKAAALQEAKTAYELSKKIEYKYVLDSIRKNKLKNPRKNVQSVK